MLTFEEVNNRLKDILSTELGEKKVYDKDVAEALDIDPAYFAVLKKRGRLPLEAVVAFCAKRSISINWLLYDQMPRTLEENTEKFATVRYFKQINASAGGGALNEDEKPETLYIDENIVRMLGGKQHLKWIDAINVIGDSMEPLIRDGATIFVDRSATEIGGGGIFVVRTLAGTFVKRLIKRSDGRVELLSINPLYPSETVLLDEIEIIGKVVGKMEGRKF
ncbi:S24 family peptidase [Hydrogenimonas thermophila]|uniref:LexA family transcriptional regulator n=1 Tax=Hydrogenimonas thermophila TaxID=223786 RepID=UPI002937301F|nr:S24 family peptidase [Hydrogenimonas thermophila]WOE70176.1 S24 family peptidase [Hydrogenimonas thermophila]WOE72693.1 S24 family peptidase [Hydrogenimonas thermophila]